MGSLGGFLCFLCLFLVVVLITILHKLWWAPTRIQKQIALQGIHGPPYKLIHGNTKGISHMMKEAMASPKTISHDTLPLVQPHIHSLTKIYVARFSGSVGDHRT
ncbi:hypothetical protein GBA52_026501 [Prunus armeniaca]|nr:hypothetical protein GBA52_026501 [Prunus armeniaca]